MEIKKKPKWQIILGCILFIWGILGIILDAIFGDFSLIRLVICGLLIWGGYELFIRKTTIYNFPKDELINNGYKYYCKECGKTYKEKDKIYTSINGQIAQKCSCGSTCLSSLEDKQP